MKYIVLSLLFFSFCLNSKENLLVQEPLFGTTINFNLLPPVPKEMACALKLSADTDKIISRVKTDAIEYFLIQSLVPIDGKIKEGDGGSVVIKNTSGYKLIGSPLTSFPNMYPEVPTKIADDLLDDAVVRFIQIFGGKKNFEHALVETKLCSTYSNFFMHGLEKRDILICK